MRGNLLDRLHSKVLLCDGGMGTQLQNAGLQAGECGDLWNLERPDDLLAIQRKYARAGCDCLISNTFNSNPINLRRHEKENECAAISKAGVELAREAIGENGFVLGGMGPFGGFIEPLGEYTEQEVTAAFAEQARALLEGGADAIIIETMTATEELIAAVRGAREAGAETVIASMSYDAAAGSYRTMMGVGPGAAVKALEMESYDVIACNCGSGLVITDYVEIVKQYRAVTEKPIMIQPNAGNPELVGGHVIYREEPETMAAAIADLAGAGANIIGGCCGTDVRHITLFRNELNKITRL